MPSVFRKAHAPLLALLGLAALASAADPKPVAESPHMLARDKQRLVDFTAELNGSKELYLLVAEIDVGRIEDLRGGRPDGDFEAFWNRE